MNFDTFGVPYAWGIGGPGKSWKSPRFFVSKRVGTLDQLNEWKVKTLEFVV